MTTAPSLIAVTVAHRYGVTVQELRSGEKWRPLPLARREAAREIHAAHPHYSLPDIAPLCGYRSHSSVHEALHRSTP